MTRFNVDKLQPWEEPDHAGVTAIKLTDGVYVAGQVLEAATPATEVQTITFPGGETGGTFKLRFKGVETAALAYNTSTSALQTALRGLVSIGAGNVTITGSAGAYTATFAGDLVYRPMPLFEVADNSLTGPSPGDIAIAVTTEGYGYQTFKAYTSGPAKGLLKFGVTVDADLGDTDVKYGDEATGQTNATMYTRGTFLVGDLTGLDADAVEDLHGRLIGTGNSQKLVF